MEVVCNIPLSNLQAANKADTTSSSSNDALFGHLEASQSPLRRRQLQHRPVAAMSLVGLKHIFFRESRTLVPSRNQTEYSKLLDRRSSDNSLLSNPRENDIESQDSDSSSSKSSSKKPFRIDARLISDATIGLSDGLTVPFALTAGLSALGNTKIVIYGGIAELLAGAISMGLGGYLGAKSEACVSFPCSQDTLLTNSSASYNATKDDVQELIAMNPQAVMSNISEVFEPYNLPQSTLEDLTVHLGQSPKLVDFIMRFQHCAEEPASSRAFASALTIAMGYFLGGLLPLLPYFAVAQDRVYDGLYISIAVMVVALFVFGYVKTCIVEGWSGARNIRGGCFGGVQMVIVGSVAAGAAMGLVRAFNQEGL